MECRAIQIVVEGLLRHRELPGSREQAKTVMISMKDLPLRPNREGESQGGS